MIGPCKISWYIFHIPEHFLNLSIIEIIHLSLSQDMQKKSLSEKISIILWSRLSEWLWSRNIVQNKTNVLVIDSSFIRRTNIGLYYAKMPCLGCVKKIFRVAIMKNIFSDIVPRFNGHNRQGHRRAIIHYHKNLQLLALDSGNHWQNYTTVMF